jgi:Malectin domain
MFMKWEIVALKRRSKRREWDSLLWSLAPKAHQSIISFRSTLLNKDTLIISTSKNQDSTQLAPSPFPLRAKLPGIIRSIVFGLLVFTGVIPIRAQLPPGWSDTDIGSPTLGSSTYSDNAFTLTGAGTGPGQDHDQMHFTYRTLDEGGNFRLTARLVSFDGVTGAQVGLTVRQGTEPGGSTGGVTYRPSAGKGPNPNVFGCFARDAEPGAMYPWRSPGTNSPLGTPCWLQLVRYGKTFAVYKSTNGKVWSQVHNASGGTFSVAGPIQVGFFVSSGGDGTVKATVDSVKLEKNPALAYESSWIGNSFSSYYDGYVSGGSTAMWVGPDGTCYVTSSWDEAGQGGKSYKDGKIVHRFTLGTGHPYEGSIASDGTHLYYFGAISTERNGIYQTDLSGSINSGYQPLYLQSPLLDPKTGRNKMTGLAYGNGELYVSDQATGQVLVVNPAQNTYGAGPAVINMIVTQTIDTSGVTHPAPEAVYQSTLGNEAVSMSIPGLTSGKSYNVRLHFAELNPKDNAAGQRVMNLSVGSQKVTDFDIYATAGALYKATVVPFSNVTPDESGNLEVRLSRAASSVDRWAAISGIEILNANDSPFLAINCGGADSGDWKSTPHEIPGRDFSFTRPGPIAVDKSGGLWITQETDGWPPLFHHTSTPNGAAIKLYDKNGNYLNKQITDVVNPTALSYDRASDRLLVAENGPAQNIRFYNLYTGTDKAPACTSTFGEPGGIFSGKTPGLIHDPAAGGDARFFGPTGVGLDSAGNIYVVCNSGGNQTDLRAFSPDGKLLWNLAALEMTHTGDFDPNAGDSDVWTATHHYTMDYKGSKAGAEWRLKSYINNPFAYTYPSNLGGCNAVYRKIKGTPLLFTGGQGIVNNIYVYRFSGEQIIPCGSFSIKHGQPGIQMWSDTNGDGVEQPEEDSVVTPLRGFQSFDVGNNGDIYLATGDVGGTPPKVEKIPFQGFNAKGVPLYSTTPVAFASFDQFSDLANGNVSRLRYVGGPLDTMYLLGRTIARPKDGNIGGTLGCYDHWSTKPVKRFVIVLPTPMDDLNFLNYPPYSGDGFVYEAFDVANGMAFCTDLWGTIRVIDAKGNFVMNMLPGPDIGSDNAWEDENMGLRAHYNSERGEYDILQENSGFRARENFYRWTPKPHDHK